MPSMASGQWSSQDRVQIKKHFSIEIVFKLICQGYARLQEFVCDIFASFPSREIRQSWPISNNSVQFHLRGSYTALVWRNKPKIVAMLMSIHFWPHRFVISQIASSNFDDMTRTSASWCVAGRHCRTLVSLSKRLGCRTLAAMTERILAAAVSCLL